MRTAAIAAVAVLAALGLAGCETATPYQPLNPNAAYAGGYSQTQIEHDRWRVGFAGNTATDRATVETYLLYRAAELTVSQGYDWFETTQRDVDSHSETVVDPTGPYGFGWRPYWRAWGSGGWGGWGPWDPYWDESFDVQTFKSYEASAEIVLGHGQKPLGDRRAFDAREVLVNLGPKIVKPK